MHGFQKNLTNPGYSLKTMVPAREMIIPLVLFAVSVYFWDNPVIYPVKLLTVFFHELSHGLAAVLTGGSMLKIELSSNLGGLCWTSGGNRVIVLSAGYLGSLFWGASILLLAAKTNWDKYIVKFLGIMLVIVSVIWVRSAAGLAFGVLFGAGLAALGHYASEKFCDQFLRYMGLVSCFYVILDIKDDLIVRNIPSSDAYRLGEILHLPGYVVGGLWFIFALAVTWFVLRLAFDDGKA